jgi:NAD(P)-dependent dehydrogenase (short-subunit alcohol dehydrogenase family)
VNNAGVGLDQFRPINQVPVSDVRDTYEVNVFGVIAVTNHMIPLLTRAPAARVVNMSSPLGSSPAT